MTAKLAGSFDAKRRVEDPNVKKVAGCLRVLAGQG